MLKKMITFLFIMVFSMGVLGCESESEKQEAALKKQKQETREKMIKGEIVKSPKRVWTVTGEVKDSK